ncbi:hypothetical protein B0F90DRAFT_1736952 [Multifurca ochricompacta]|uniref:Protein kinase domain-containing protein n=1 Tax=Multifurca ochricompacta TaxID=376703 RepID=A0AAD4M313_9AGAM|nr:hypothetical protein B0F90DRAFT_1736952 [Multifurca ochricompacta]
MSQEPWDIEEEPGRDGGDLYPGEKLWANRQRALEEAGYMLRRRYHPGWKSSWIGTNRLFTRVEDGQVQLKRVIMDATRISDDKPVMLKLLLPKEGPYELEINRLFSSEPLLSNPRNHCAPLLDTIDLPNEPQMMVHAQLRPFNDPPMQTYGEFVAFFGQLCEGIQFMHENHVAHRDCTRANIMLEPSGMYPQSFHPVAINRSRDFRKKANGYSRTRRPPLYLLIDFGLSRRYDPANGPPLDKPLRGGDKSAPEHQDRDTPCNPFPTDIYYIGNLVREEFSQKYLGFEFMNPLVADMTLDDPQGRPTAQEVVSRFEEIKRGLGVWKLRSRIARKNEIWPVAVLRSVSHLYRTAGYVLTRTAAIPEPR